MKKFQLFLTICLLAVATNASAQFANTGASGGSTTQKSGSVLVKDTDNYSRFYIGYNPIKAKIDQKDADDMKFHSLAFGFTQGINLVKTLPLFLEVGGNLSYSFHSEDYGETIWGEDYEEDLSGDTTIPDLRQKYSVFSLNVPVSVAYKFSFGNKGLSLTPYLGLNFRFNLAGTMKYVFKNYDDVADEQGWDNYVDNYEDWLKNMEMQEKTKLFDDDKKEMGNDAWKRFQVGFNFGLGFSYKALYVGVGYTTDFSEIAKKSKLGVTTLSLGVNF